MKKFLPLIILLVLVFIFVVAYFVMDSSNKSALVELELKLDEVRKTSIQTESTVVANQRAIKQQVSGVDSARVERENKMMDEVFKKILTWDDENQYLATRDYILDTYGDVVSQDFMNTFFLDTSAYSYISDGKTVQEFGDIANLSYVSMDPYVIDIVGDVYSYVTFVYVSSSHSGTGFTGQKVCIFKYSIDKDGNLVSFMGDAIFGSE